MDSERIAQLLRPYITLSAEQLGQVSVYIDLLLKWNARVNLTAVRNVDEIVTRHFGESFFAAGRLLARDSATEVIDLGSGAGFPGLPLAIYAPAARVALMEASAKKAAFLNEAISVLKLGNARVLNTRAEDSTETADLVIMRAVERFGEALKMAARLTRDGGQIALMIGAAQESEARERLPGFEWRSPVAIPGSQSRVLLAGTKMVKVG